MHEITNLKENRKNTVYKTYQITISEEVRKLMANRAYTFLRNIRKEFACLPPQYVHILYCTICRNFNYILR